MTDPDALKPLLPSARAELAKQIDTGIGNAAALVAQSGFSWNLAFVLSRAISGEGPFNWQYLQNEGVPSQPARVISAAIAESRAAIAAAAVGSRGGAPKPARGANPGGKNYVPHSPYRSKLDLGW